MCLGKLSCSGNASSISCLERLSPYVENSSMDLCFVKSWNMPRVSFVKCSKGIGGHGDQRLRIQRTSVGEGIPSDRDFHYISGRRRSLSSTTVKNRHILT